MHPQTRLILLSIQHVRFENITVHNPRRDCSPDKAFYDDAHYAWRLNGKRNSLIKSCLFNPLHTVYRINHGKQIINDKQMLKK